MPIKYTISDKISLLCTTLFGTVDKNDALEYATLLNSNQSAGEVSKTLAIVKECELMVNLEDVESFTRKLAISPTLKKRDRIAVLIESPNDTVVATIFAQTMKTLRKGIMVELFYTIDAAISFLELTDYRDEIQELILEQAV